jgi:hypothetical protein
MARHPGGFPADSDPATYPQRKPGRDANTFKDGLTGYCGDHVNEHEKCDNERCWCPCHLELDKIRDHYARDTRIAPHATTLTTTTLRAIAQSALDYARERGEGWFEPGALVFEKLTPGGRIPERDHMVACSPEVVLALLEVTDAELRALAMTAAKHNWYKDNQANGFKLWREKYGPIQRAQPELARHREERVDYIVACSPAVVLNLLDRIAALEAPQNNDEISAAIAGVLSAPREESPE